MDIERLRNLLSPGNLGDFGYYVYCLIGLVLAILVFRKVAGCVLRIMLFILIAAALAAIYFLHFRPMS